MFCNCACRIVLMILNGVLGLLGLVIFIVGALFLWGKEVIRSILNNFITPLLKEINVGQDASTISDMMSKILSTTAPIGIALVVLGGIIMIISGFGYCGACCNMKILLYIYAALLIVIATLHIILLIVYFARKDLVVKYTDVLLKTSVDNYQSLDSADIYSLLLALLMPPLRCCGYNNGEDFKTTGKFKSTDSYQGQSYTGLKYPIPCCNMTDYKITSSSCPANFTDTNSNIKVGCKTPIETQVLHYTDIVAYCSLIGLFFVIALILFTFITTCIDVV